jgi:hypothetical protein
MPGKVSLGQWTSYIEYLKRVKSDFEKFKKYTKIAPTHKGDFLTNICMENLKWINKNRKQF